MSTTSYGPGTKKETVYGGLPPGTTGTVYSGPPVPGTTGTVYQGPSPGGTVYQGQMRNGQAARRVDASASVRKAGALFYYIAAISLINTLLALVNAKYAMAMGLGTTRAFDASSQAQIAAVLVTNALIAGVFFAIGLFARKGSSVAFLIGILLYGLDLVLLCSDFSRHAPAVAVHGYFIYKMIAALRELRS